MLAFCELSRAEEDALRGALHCHSDIGLILDKKNGSSAPSVATARFFPPSSQPANLDAEVTIPLTVSDSSPRRTPKLQGQIANQRQGSIEGPSFVHGHLV
ncbi:unnamed protein product [Pleuronectes platessa]|uniref:Uncharacterized protein n=1 Tax=Pleuronectes platessa TaxID=8262 RepID=A0A9N7UMV6_PLEPL|nr:unnamed protein product [Pleuronectes platessa]